MRAANRSSHERRDSSRNRLIVVSGGLGAGHDAARWYGDHRRVVAADGHHDADRRDDLDRGPDDHGRADDGGSDDHPGADDHGRADDDVAPTTTAPSPAIVPVAAPDYPYVAVGSSGGGETAADPTAPPRPRLLELPAPTASTD